jgi:hypothetical protein
MIADEIWLVIAEHPRYLNRAKVVKMTNKAPALERGEKAIKVNVTVPDNFFKQPEYELNIDIPTIKGLSEEEIKVDITEYLYQNIKNHD